MLIIVNPTSGTGKQDRVLKAIEKYLDTSKFDHSIAYTKAHRHAIELTSNAVSEGFDVVVIVGGDGSINEVGQALAGTKVIMGIIPAGSGNGLGRALRIPMKAERAVKNLNELNTRVIDSGTVNGKPFMNMAGVGLDAHVAYRFHKQKMRGLWKYIMLIIRSLWDYKYQEYQIRTTEGPKFKRRAVLIALANSPQYGNEALVSPTAVIDDGELNCVVLNPFPFPVIFVLIFRLFRGTLHRSPYIKTFSFKSMILEQERNDVIHLDGDPYNLGKELTIEIRKNSISVIVPHEKA